MLVLLLTAGVLASLQEPAAPPSPLKETVVVPAFSSPLPENRNVVWCATFQMAWDRMSEQLKSPLKVKGAEELSELLQRSTFPKDGIPEGAGYSAAGKVEDGIFDVLDKDLKRLFADAAPKVERVSAGWVAYAVLKAALKFEPRFPADKIQFVNSGGKSSDVNAFGLFPGDAWDYPKVRKQVRILYCDPGYGKQTGFALDPCETTGPLQVILAKVPRKASLAETWAELERRRAIPRKYQQTGLGGNDIFSCPDIKMSLTHRFVELEGRPVALKSGEPDLQIAVAKQSILFTLDRGGAKLESESMLHLSPIPAEFILDGPFLVVLKKREGGAPFFALWVDNPEILVPVR